MSAKLYEIIEEIEAKLPKADADNALVLHQQLGQYYQYSNADKAIHHAGQVIDSTLPQYHPLKVKAITSIISGMLTNTRFKEAYELVQSIDDTAIEDERIRLIFLMSKATILAIMNKRDELTAILEEYGPAILELNDAELLCSYVVPKNLWDRINKKDSSDLFLRALEASKPWPWISGYIHTLIGEWADDNQHRDFALQHLNAAIEICNEQRAYLYLFQAYLYRHNLYATRNETGSSMEDITLAYEIAKLTGNTVLQNYAIQKRTNCYIVNGEYEKALQDLAVLDDAYTRTNEPNKQNTNRRTRAVIYFKTGNYQAALDNFLEYKRYVESVQHVVMNDFINWDLSNCYMKLGQYEEAYNYLFQFHKEQKEINEQDRRKALAEMQVRYDTERKEAQLKQLQIDNLNSELRLLKSQMNPHFLFNAISSVNNLLHIGKHSEAQQSLQQLAVLTRSTLEQSRGEETLLEDEIAFLESYLHLEGQVLGNDFTFSITVDDSIDTSFDKVPAMLIQPLVENALKHGLRTKQGSKHLSLSFNMQQQVDSTVLTISITDNGIGRMASMELNKNRTNHHSFATKSIEDRIKIINTTSGYNKISMETLDLAEHNLSTGTQVLLIITKR